jgi:2-polyprenyl-3-methyl-5-hydroxy-6-metoxy-1,4-benzoquinol methylase
MPSRIARAAFGAKLVEVMDAQEHWERIYDTTAPNQVSWFRPHLLKSLDLIERATTDRGASIIDVGSGVSTLVDDLLATGYRNLTVLDISQAAIEVAKNRLGPAVQSKRISLHTLTTCGMTGRCFIS